MPAAKKTSAASGASKSKATRSTSRTANTRSKPKSKRKTNPLKKPTPKKTSKKIKPTRKDTLTKNNPLSLPQSYSLTKLSPFRFPIDTNLLAIQMARFAGLAMVVLGGFFTLWNLQAFTNSLHVLETDSHVAQTCSSADPECTSSTEGSADIDSDSGCHIEDTACLDAYYGTEHDTATSQYYEPTVVFEIVETEPLVDTVTIIVNVDAASAVKVLAFHKDELQLHTLGAATKKSESEWHYRWNTTQFLDGDYRLKAIVTSDQITYDQSDTDYYTVENYAYVETSATTTETTTEPVVDMVATTTTDNQTEEANVYTAPKIKSPNGSELGGEVRFTIHAPEAKDVRVIAESKSDNSKQPIGYAHQKIIDGSASSEEWYINWDTKAVPDGEYRVRAISLYDGFSQTSERLTVILKNTQTNEELTDTTETKIITEIDSTTTPTITLTFAEPAPLEGKADLFISISIDPDFIEVYAIPALSNTQKFVGLAKQIDRNRWKLPLDTTQMPNGGYLWFVRAKTPYGLHESSRVKMSVANEIATTIVDDPDQTSEYETITKEIDAVTKTTEPIINTPTQPDVEDQPDEETIILDDTETAKRKALQLIAEYKLEIDDELQRLASAIRVGDQEKVADIKSRLEEITQEIISSVQSEAMAEQLVTEIKTRTRELMQRLTENTERTEQIIRERVGENISKDTDQDGITDYDEVVLYNTDPNTADSDGDGFIDGAEILNNFDPTDATPEAVVTFESPKEAGVVRPDILEVSSITAIEPDPDDTASDGVASQAVISGQALPNSFVTLYIFSTPVIVTVKTAADGSWSYTFDKELEDGEHEVYVGVTDNAGKIVAKSEPLRFVKQAQAFTPVDAAASAPISTEPPAQNSLTTQNMILAILSISVVGIGLTLILIGMHLARRRNELLPDSATQISNQSA